LEGSVKVLQLTVLFCPLTASLSLTDPA